MKKFGRLFEPGRIGTLELKNRTDPSSLHAAAYAETKEGRSRGIAGTIG